VVASWLYSELFEVPLKLSIEHLAAANQ
jgi:hypothetical protein